MYVYVYVMNYAPHVPYTWRYDMFVCTCVCYELCMHVYACIMHLGMHACMYACMYVCNSFTPVTRLAVFDTYVCVYVYVPVRMCMYVCVCM